MFTAFNYEYLFWKYRFTRRLKSEVILREKIGFVVFHRMHDTNKARRSNQKKSTRGHFVRDEKKSFAEWHIHVHQPFWRPFAKKKFTKKRSFFLNSSNNTSRKHVLGSSVVSRKARTIFEPKVNWRQRTLNAHRACRVKYVVVETSIWVVM